MKNGMSEIRTNYGREDKERVRIDPLMRDWVWILCNETLESGLVPEDWRTSSRKGKMERTELGTRVVLV